MYRKFTMYVLTALLLVLPLTGCAIEQPVTADEGFVNVVELRTTDNGFEFQDSVPAGYVEIQYGNSSAMPNHAQLIRVQNDRSPEELMGALQRFDFPTAQELGQFYGGAVMTMPGMKNAIELQLEPGQYLWTSFMAEGMPYTTFTVEGEISAGTELHGDIVIDMHDFAFTLPSDIDANTSLIEVYNSGPQPHELVIMRMEEGKDSQDAFAFFMDESGQTPPPGMPVGGTQAIHQGQTVYVPVELQTGTTYVIVCLVPDFTQLDPNAPPVSHMENGMIAQFTAQ